VGSLAIEERQHADVFPHGYGRESKAKTGGFMAEMKYRLVRVADFTAESLEAEADRVPPSMKEHADSLRKMAKIMRQSDNQKMVRVWEEQTGIEGADFIMHDPASH
jgi:hypothetical protein